MFFLATQGNRLEDILAGARAAAAARVRVDAEARLDRDVLAAERAVQVNIQDRDADELHNDEHGVIAVSGNAAVQGDNAGLTDDRLEVAFHTGADARIALEGHRKA